MKSSQLRTISEVSHESGYTTDDKSSNTNEDKFEFSHRTSLKMEELDKPSISRRTKMAMEKLEKLKLENEDLRLSKQRSIVTMLSSQAIQKSENPQRSNGALEASKSISSEADAGINSCEWVSVVSVSQDLSESVASPIISKGGGAFRDGHRKLKGSKVPSCLHSGSSPPLIPESDQLDPTHGKKSHRNDRGLPGKVRVENCKLTEQQSICVTGSGSIQTTSAGYLKFNKRIISNDSLGVNCMSSLTKVAREEMDILKRENERLKKENLRDKDKMRYLEYERAMSTKARVDDIKNLIQRAQELDIAFLVDATYSMQPSIEMVKNEIAGMAAGIGQSYPRCKLRFALAIYRDYDDPDDASGCNFTSIYDKPDSEFSQALSRIKCEGGADLAEDVFTGLETVANLDWQATNRLLVHIADAPCHGSQFHELGTTGDHYHGGDKYGRDINTILKKLREMSKITLYCFCHITDNTLKMLQEFQKEIQDDYWVEEWRLSDISKIPEKVVAVSRSTIARSLSVLQIGETGDSKYVQEKVVNKVPSWILLKIQNGEEYIHPQFSSLRDLLDAVRETRVLKLIRSRDVQLKISLHPFSGEGSVRWPYYALVNQKGSSQPKSEVVLKRFKIPFGKSPRQVHSKACYVNQMEVQTVAGYLAEQFYKCTLHLRGVMKIHFTEVSLVKVGDKFYTMEKLLRGEWTRYSNNGKYVNMTDYAATLQAFSHWTYHVSNGLLMVTDLQGVKQEDKSLPGKHIFCLCDPAIHTNDENVMRFTGTNLGEQGFKLFLDNHKCNDVCRHLALPVGMAGHTFKGTIISDSF